MPNPTRYIRAGFDYQDYWALKVCAEWLANPGKYAWVQFETTPDDQTGTRFYLDDIVCQAPDGLFEFFQVKHKHDCQNEWTWDDLIVPARQRGTSRIKKWAQSLLPRLTKTRQALLVTDGSAAEEVLEYLDGGWIQTATVRQGDPDLYARLCDEIGADAEVDSFFGKLQFRFAQPGPDELEEDVRQFLYRELFATESGVTNLLSRIHKECRQASPRRLDIATLREWCEFDVPRPLDEEFEVPDDFEFFDDDAHQELLRDLQQPTGGIRVVCGRPGVGKSVYLSRLDKELRDAGVACVKHHYHISPEDANPQERLNAERVVEALKAQFKERADDLGNLANKNSREISVGEFVSAVGRKRATANKTLVVIVDGLDHVPRYGQKEELESFLQEICRPQPGVWFVFGMQPVAKPHLPRIVFERCPESSWILVRGLARDLVEHIVKANAVGLNLPDEWRQIRDLLDRLFEITEGNPLHLRYTLQQLKNREQDSLVTEYSCDGLLPYGGDVATYYEALWAQLPGAAKTVLLTTASVNFRFTQRQLIECVSSFETPTQVTESFGAVAHLVRRSRRDLISVYHNSFEVFLWNRPELEEQRPSIKRQVKAWLESSSHDYLKWAELRIIEHELGNSRPLLEIDRGWLIESICRPSNPNQIRKQLSLASHVAFDSGDYPGALRLSHLQMYYENSRDYFEEVNRLILAEAVRRAPRALEYLDVEQLPVETLVAACEVAEATGDVVAREEIVPELSVRSSRQEYRNGQIPQTTSALLRVLPFKRGHNTESVVEYITQFRDMEVTPALFAEYARGLLALEQQGKVEEVLASQITADEGAAILREYARHRLGVGSVELPSAYDGFEDLPAECLLHAFLELGSCELPDLIRYEELPGKLEDYDMEARSKWESTFHEQFLIALTSSLLGQGAVVEEWRREAPDSWSADAMAALLRGARAIGESQGAIQYSALFQCLADIEELKWPNDRDLLALQHALKASVCRIIRDIFALKRLGAALSRRLRSLDGAGSYGHRWRRIGA